MIPRRALSGLLLLCFSCLAQVAAADSKACISQNNDGADRRAAHQLLAARDAYRACVTEPECPSVVRDECDAALTDLKKAIPTVLVSVVDGAQHDIPGATLLVDDKPFAVDGSPLELDPGPHQLVAHGGSLSSSMQIVVIENDLNRRVELALLAPTVSDPATQLPRDPEAAPKRSLVPSYVLGGVGVLGAASFGYFALSGHSELNQLEQCKPFCAASDVRSVRTKYLVADISLGVSLVALATAGYLYFRAPAAEAPRAGNTLSVAVGAAPGAASVSVRWVQ